MSLANEATFQGSFSCVLEKNKLKLEGEVAETNTNHLFHFNAETSLPMIGSKGHCQIEDTDVNQKLNMHFTLRDDFSFSWEEINGTLGKTSVDLKFEETSDGLKGYRGNIHTQSSDASLWMSHYLTSLKPSHCEELALKGKFLVGPQSEWEFNGSFDAKNLKWETWSFEEIKGKLTSSSNQWVFEDVKVQDPAMELSIPQLSLARDSDLQFIIPTMEIHTIAPHLLYPESLSERFRGWTIQKGILNQLSGALNNPQSWSGNGTLSFSRDHSVQKPLFEFNTESFNTLGFHPSPASGEIGFELKEGKFLLVQLKNVKGSEGKTEFLLPKTPISCYLDYQGNLHLDFTLKQSNNTKFSQLFNLSIRGTLENPELSVR